LCALMSAVEAVGCSESPVTEKREFLHCTVDEVTAGLERADLVELVFGLAALAADRSRVIGGLHDRLEALEVGR